jgi:hypothetical protein
MKDCFHWQASGQHCGKKLGKNDFIITKFQSQLYYLPIPDSTYKQASPQLPSPSARAAAYQAM